MSHPLLSFSLKPWVAVVSMALAANTAWAADPLSSKTSRSRGCSAWRRQQCFAPFPVKIGDTYSDERGAAAIRSLLPSGCFQDVRIDVRDDNMVIVVQER